MKNPYLIIMTLCLLSFQLQAQNDTTRVTYFDLSLEELLNIPISSASKFSQKISDAPSVVSLVSQNQIQKYGWISIHDIMGTLPGFSQSKDYDRRTLSSRGLYEGWNNNHLLMLVDGVPVNDNLYGTAYTWEITPLVFTKSLEIIRGPGSALYGSNATNGVITMNTMSPGDLGGIGIARTRIGSRGTRIYDAITGAENDKASILLAFNSYETKGNEYFSHDATVDASGNPVTSLRKVQDSRSSNYIFAKIAAKGKLQGLSLQYHEQNWDFETGHGWLFSIPDQPESMKESRRIIALKYKPENVTSKFGYELMTRYQRHGLDWNMRYYRDRTVDGYGTYLHNGLTEYLESHADDLLTRIQVNYSLGTESSLLAGIEHTLFLYNGDRAHLSNANLNDDYGPNPGNQFIDINPWFEFIDGKPVNTLGIFGQYVSPKIGGKLQATVGARFDTQSFDYVDIYDSRKEKSKSFSQFSPRLGLVFFANENLTFKGLAGRAFRIPAPTEMFGANTYSLASNIGNLEPEIITTYEIATDWKINSQFNIRVNGFYTDFENQIAYGADNLSDNVYSLTSTGFESELFYTKNKFSGFLNYSHVFRNDEEILYDGIIKSEEVTWVPQQTLNFGITYTSKKYYLSSVIHYQGEVNRRASDITPETSAFRPETVEAWTEMDLKFAFTPSKRVELGVLVKNLFDSENYLIKNNAYTFDYRRADRTILLDVKLTL